MKNKNLLITILVAIICAGVGFFAGFKYQQVRRNTAFRQFGGPDGQRMEMGQTRNGFRPVNGEIINVDEKSITVKMQDGSSRIVLLSDSTQINKASQASKEDLKTSETVAVFGTENSDGSVTAQNIQLNPEFRNIQNPSQ